MKHRLFQIILGFGLLLWSGCDEDFFSTTVQVEPPPYDPVLVVHSVLTDVDTSFFIGSVTESLGWFESDNFFENRVDDAVMEVFKSDELVFTFEAFESFPNYLYNNSDPLLGHGEVFELRVTHPDFGVVRSIQKMPVPVPVTKVENLGPVVLGEEFEIGTGIEIEFTDPPGVANFYEIELVAKQPSGGSSNNIQLYSSDPNVSEIWNGQKLVISDAAIDGQTYSFLIQTDEERGLILIWNCVTEDYYNYVRRLELQEETDFNPFAEPVSIISNIENGLGLFGLRAQLRYDVPPE